MCWILSCQCSSCYFYSFTEARTRGTFALQHTTTAPQAFETSSSAIHCDHCPPNNIFKIHFNFVLSPIFQSLIATNELLRLQDRHWRSLMQPTGLAGMPSTGYVRSAVALRWYYMRQVSRASWLPLQTMVRNEVFRDHPLRKIITLHPAIPQGLLDAALNRIFKAFAVLFLMSPHVAGGDK